MGDPSVGGCLHLGPHHPQGGEAEEAPQSPATCIWSALRRGGPPRILFSTPANVTTWFLASCFFWLYLGILRRGEFHPHFTAVTTEAYRSREISLIKVI